MTPAIRLVSGAQSVVVTGAVAEMVALLAESQDAINAHERASLRIDYAPDGVTVRLVDVVLGKRRRCLAAA